MTLRVSSTSSAGDEYSALVDRGGCEGMTVNAFVAEARATAANAVLVIIIVCCFRQCNFVVGFWQMDKISMFGVEDNILL